MKVRTNMSLDEETMKMLKKLASEQHISVSGWVNQKVWEEAKKRDITEQLTREIIDKANTTTV